MKFQEGMTPNLPISSLAVPPTELDRLSPRINLNDMHL